MDNNIQRLISDIIKDIQIFHDHDVVLLFGAELEFYIYDYSYEDLVAEILPLYHNIIERFDKEDGLNQFECVFAATDDPITLCNNIDIVKKTILQKGGDCRALPDISNPGSGLHLHIAMYNKSGINLFVTFDDKYTKKLYNVIGGLMHHMLSSMVIFAPDSNSYARLMPQQSYPLYKHYPTNCSWGKNNRTCAIRLPRVVDINDTRIEHRVASSDACPYLTMLAILFAIYDGIRNQMIPPEPIFGDAFDVQYSDIKSFPRNLAEAQGLFTDSDINKLLSIYNISI